METPATRTAVTGLTRYIVEAYEGENLAAEPMRAESATGALTVILKKNTDYTFLFWADKGTAKTEDVASSGYWNTNDLKTVTVTETEKSKVGQVAYCLKVSFNSKDFELNKNVKLKNATAQVNFIEGIGLETADNTLTVTYAAGSTLNVGTGKVEEVVGAVTHTFTGIAQLAASITLATDYVLAPLDEQSVHDLKIQFNFEAKKELANVPFRQNYKTNIKGEYSNLYTSTFTVSNVVEDYENKPDVEFPRAYVGDFYYSDNTFSTTLNPAKTCIGIVISYDKTFNMGKILSLDETTGLAWNLNNTGIGDVFWGDTSSI